MDLNALTRGQRLTIGAAVLLSVAAGAVRIIDAKSVTTFVVAAAALAALAALVGQSIEQVGERMGPGATGLLQSALGNLPELFVGIFALQAGLVDVVRAALVGSVLANTLLILGLAILTGGLRHGVQRFASDSPRMIGTLLLLAVAALLVPTLATRLHTPAAAHASQLSNAVAIILIAVYVLSIPFWLRGGALTGPCKPDQKPNQKQDQKQDEKQDDEDNTWPLPLALGLLAFASLGAALVSDWFVGALEPATKTLGLSPTFTGLVIVAIASNAVENVGGITFAWKARPDYALSTILNSPLQVALFLTPLLVLASQAVGPTRLTLVFPALEVAAMALATLVVLVVISDGEYVWLEGVALIGLYGIVTAAFWWG
ncbi:MAG: calcium/proton exchanger [Actinomycetota bacterium]|nr:calcium/proton exchanger [Actinomycetota bacterium]